MSADPFFDEDPLGWAPLEPGVSVEAVDIIHRRDHPFKKKPDGKRGCAECGAGKTRMVHVGATKSLNVFGSSANQFAYQGMKKEWEARLTQLLAEAGLPRGLGYVFAEGQMCFPDRRARDQGNYRFILEKALGDALQAGGWLENDDWSHFEFGRLRYAYEKGESWTALTIHPSVETPSLAPDFPAQPSLL